jgi:hypothetical protein
MAIVPNGHRFQNERERSSPDGASTTGPLRHGHSTPWSRALGEQSRCTAVHDSAGRPVERHPAGRGAEQSIVGATRDSMSGPVDSGRSVKK